MTFKKLLYITIIILFIPLLSQSSWDYFVEKEEYISEEDRHEFVDEDEDGLCDICGKSFEEGVENHYLSEEQTETSEVHCEGGVCTIKED
jgi:hypothetical protein